MNTSQRQRYLQLLGIDQWVSKIPVVAAASSDHSSISTRERAPTRGAPTFSSTTMADENEWETLAQCVANCMACGLHKTRTQTVFGVGYRKASLMMIGEAPGATEDKKGEPFVGRAGQLLDEMLHAIGLQREQIFIANILKCRPPNNRDPSPEEVATCTPFLDRQIALLKPQLIVTLGRIAAHHLLKTTHSLTNLRGKQFYYGVEKIPVLATYHPAYLLRTPRDKRKAYQDLQTIHRLLNQELSL